jgi:ABC-type antimicrobial peptide transport system permease subunit
VIVGTLGGIICAASGQNLLNNLIEGASALDFATAGVATLSICFIAAVSTWVATRRIADLDVLEILRAE